MNDLDETVTNWLRAYDLFLPKNTWGLSSSDPFGYLSHGSPHDGIFHPSYWIVCKELAYFRTMNPEEASPKPGKHQAQQSVITSVVDRFMDSIDELVQTKEEIVRLKSIQFALTTDRVSVGMELQKLEDKAKNLRTQIQNELRNSTSH